MDDVADSTDWLGTPLSGLAPLESGLRCQVCKDFFTTPMITSCSHTFCSLCIRRYLSQEGKCPACREPDQELKLRRNWTVEELVAHFTQARDQILAVARQPPTRQDDRESERPRKRRKVEPVANGAQRRSTRSQSKRLATAGSHASQELASTQEEVADSEEEGSVYHDDDAPPKTRSPRSQQNIAQPHDGLVACPCCNRRMKEASINAHLDRCIQGLPTSPDPPAAQPQNPIPSSSLAFAQQTKSPTATSQKDRLPSINYALYTEASLRKKLKELGIPNHGNKELMRKRHIEWMNLWNANCDSSRPRTKRELLKDLDTWERTLGRQLEKGTASGISGVMVKDFDRDGWVKAQKGEFDDLIKKAREKRRAAGAAVEGEADGNTVDGDTKMGDVPVDTSVHVQEPGISAEAGGESAGMQKLQAQADGIHTLSPVASRADDTESGSCRIVPEPLLNGHLGTPPIQQEQVSIDVMSSPAVDGAVDDAGGSMTPSKRSKFFV